MKLVVFKNDDIEILDGDPLETKMFPGEIARAFYSREYTPGHIRREKGIVTFRINGYDYLSYEDCHSDSIENIVLLNRPKQYKGFGKFIKDKGL